MTVLFGFLRKMSNDKARKKKEQVMNKIWRYIDAI